MRSFEETVELVQNIEALKDVPRHEIEWLVRESTLEHIEPGFFVRPGDVIYSLVIALSGWIRSYSLQGQQQRELQSWGYGLISGFLPYSRMKTSPVYVEIVEPVDALMLHRDKFRTMMCESPELTGALVHVMTDRVKAFTSAHFQNEKLMALGKLSAGLAHELNNPAAAIVRASQDLLTQIGSLSDKLGEFANLNLSSSEVEKLKELLKPASDEATKRLSLLERKAAEDDLLDWLEDNGVEHDADEIASTFVQRGLTVDDIEKVRSSIPNASLAPVLSWMCGSFSTQQSVQEIGEASKRISSLIGSVKSYTRMDQVQDRQPVNINESLRSTLTILQHKIRKNNIKLSEELDESIPLVSGFPGELIQVWTNVIDNSLDAMEETGGKLHVKSYMKDSKVAVEVVDTGKGIPEEVKERIFDPFFTTKPVGKGTGVGLDLVMKIVSRHNGRIDVESHPGNTTFSIHLPISPITTAAGSVANP